VSVRRQKGAVCDPAVALPAPIDAAPQDGLPLSVRRVGALLVSLATLAQLARALVRLEGRDQWPLYLGLGAAYLLLVTLTILRPPRRSWQVHLALALQCLLALALLAIKPELDFLSALLVPVAFEAALQFTSRTAWCWVAGSAALTAGSLMVLLEPLRGLSLALTPIALELLLAAFVAVAREIEAARRQSETMLQELEVTHARLEAYAAQAGELAAVVERDRVARDLNDSVATTIVEILEAARVARAGLATVEGRAAAGDATAPPPATAQLAALQRQTQQALAQMRALIAELRPHES